MFTLQQIEQAHNKVSSGADFPNYIQDIKTLGVQSFETWVIDSHTVYYGANNFQIQSSGQYQPLTISAVVRKETFENYLKIHQQGKTDYYTFCKHCVETGIEKWIVDLSTMTCTYYDIDGKEVLEEFIA